MATTTLPVGARKILEHSDREVCEATLLELIEAVCSVTEDDTEVIATVMHLLLSGRVRLCGNFRDVELEELETWAESA